MVNTLTNAGDSGCATGTVTIGIDSIDASACAAGEFVHLPYVTFPGTVQAEACYEPTSGTKRCVTAVIPELW